MQDFLLALTDPSTQINVSPWHRSMPPFLPLHGVFVAAADPAANKTITAITNPFITAPALSGRIIRRNGLMKHSCRWLRFARVQTYGQIWTSWCNHPASTATAFAATVDHLTLSRLIELHTLAYEGDSAEWERLFDLDHSGLRVDPSPEYLAQKAGCQGAKTVVERTEAAIFGYQLSTLDDVYPHKMGSRPFERLPRVLLLRRKNRARIFA